MTEYKISLIPGDGIGPELSEATLKVLEAAEKKFGLKFKIIDAPAGDIALETLGAALPADTVEKIKNIPRLPKRSSRRIRSRRHRETTSHV